jgi:hypothetical protein
MHGAPTVSIDGTEEFVRKVRRYSRWVPLVRLAKKGLALVQRDR